MEISAVFSDQTTSRIVIEFCDPDDDPVKLIPIGGITDRQVRNSAEIGCYAAYHLLRKCNQIKRGSRYCLTYQFAEEGRKAHILGESAGLAFCLKFAQEVYQREAGRIPQGAIAATGVVTEGGKGAQVRSVDGFVPKLQAALTALKPGDQFFYPQENDDHIGEDVKKTALMQGIQLVPVKTVEEAISHLLPGTKEPLPSKKNLLVVALILVLGTIGYWGFNKGSVQQVRDPVKVDIVLHLYKENGGYMGNFPDLREPAGGKLILHSGDAFQIEMTPDDQCFVYVYQIDSKGHVFPLFPRPNISPQNPLRPNQSYLLPGDKGYILDKTKGEETIYVIASRSPSEDLEALTLQNGSKVDGAKRDGKERKLLRTLREREKTNRAGFNEVFFSKYEFLHR